VVLVSVENTVTVTIPVIVVMVVVMVIVKVKFLESAFGYLIGLVMSEGNEEHVRCVL
jgi:hypothetical protein